MMMFAFASFVLAVGTTASTPQPRLSNMMGKWISECQPIGKGGRHGIITHITFSDNQMEAETQMFATRACTTPVLKVNYRGTVTFWQGKDDTIFVDHTVDQIVLTPQALDVVAQYNLGDDHGCGLEGWQINVGKSVAGQKCDPFAFPERGITLFDSAWVHRNTLRFGAFPMIWTNIIDDKRPTDALPAIYRHVVD